MPFGGPRLPRGERGVILGPGVVAVEYVFLGLAGLGFLISVVGGIWLLVEAFRESVGWGIGCLLCGLIQLAFLIQHWRVAKRPFLVQLAGTFLCFLAGAGIGWAEGLGGSDPFDPGATPPPAFASSLGPGTDLPGRVVRHEVRLGGSQSGFYDPPGHGGRLWVYLPPGFETAPRGSLPCVLIAPAGTSGLTGIRLGEGDEPEHTPYAEAGYVVVAYELDGPLANSDPTDAEARRAYLAYGAAQAGLVNGRIALEWVLATLPAVSPRAIYTAGHSSAGGQALLLAAHEPRLAGCVAYAPVTDLAAEHGEWAIGETWVFPRLKSFLRRASPTTHLDRLRCPVFLFHSLEDDRVQASLTRAFAGKLEAQGTETTYREVAEGDHYQSMIAEGVPAGIAWLEAHVAALGGVRPAPLPAQGGASGEPVIRMNRPPVEGVDWDDPQVILRMVGAESTRREALGQWQRRGLDRAEGARLAMLKALGPAAEEPQLVRLLLRSVGEHPPGAREALGCLPLAPEELRRALLTRLVRYPDPELPAAELVAAVEELPDTSDRLIDELLVRSDRPREGVAARLVAARGGEWARSDEARALLERLPPAELLSLAREPEEGTRLLAIRQLVARGAEVALPPLAALLRDPSPAVRQEAAGGLGELSDPQAVVPLLGALGEEQDEPTRVRMRRALANLPAQAVSEVLERLLSDPAPAQRLVAVSGLLAYASPASVRQLGKALEDGERSVRMAALEGLSQLRTSRVQGVPESVRQLTTAIGRLAASSDADEKRLARHLYYQLTGRLPEGKR